MPSRPLLAFALSPERTHHVFAPDDRARLAACCTIPQPAPIRQFVDATDLMREVEVLVTSWGCPAIDAAVLAAAPRLRLIAHAAGTVKTFIAREAFDRGIVVTHAAAANALPVAEFTLAAILFANKRVLHFRTLYAAQRRGGLAQELAREPLGNFRKTVGIIGASRIGLRVIELLRPFDLAVLLYDPFVTPADAAELGVEPAELDALLERADVVSLHAPSLPATRHMLDARRLARLRDGATLINTARGALVDQAALEAELVSGRINAVIDVTEPEVLPADSALYTLPNVLLTPHIAGALGLERQRLGALIANEVERYARSEPLWHRIDPKMLEHMA
jgi:phosphoglycerate dehydrogenase-like enzyme